MTTTKMTMRAAWFLALTFCACSHEHGLAGNWNLESPKDARISHIEFEDGGKRAQLGVTSDQQGHGHVLLEYAEANGTVVLNGAWEGHDVQWTGKFADDQLLLQGPGARWFFIVVSTGTDSIFAVPKGKPQWGTRIVPAALYYNFLHLISFCPHGQDFAF